MEIQSKQTEEQMEEKKKKTEEEPTEEKKKEMEEKRRETEEKKNDLCSSVMKGKWNEVVNIFETRRDAEVQGVKITLSQDTALHMAVNENKQETVESLVKLIDNNDVLQSADNKGNTPLHLAAKMGNEAMCACIASKNPDAKLSEKKPDTKLSEKKPDLLGIRNNDGETPLFLAALHGKEDAFIRLYVCCIQDRGDILSWEDPKICEYARRGDGKTVLHAAIDGEYFDLAFQIIIRFPNFIHFVDERGQTPFHVLASKHSSFRSSSHLTWLQKMIYFCIPPEPPTIKRDFKRPAKTRGKHSSISATKDVENACQMKQQCSTFSTFMSKQLKKAVEQVKKAALFLVTRVFPTKDLYPKQIAEMKKKHGRSEVITNLLLLRTSYYDFGRGSQPVSSHSSDISSVSAPHAEHSNQDNNKNEGSQVSSQSSQAKKSRKKKSRKNKPIKETPILIAAKNGITEIVDSILKALPVAIHDVNSEGKNLVHLAVENRQPHVYKLLVEREHAKINLLYQVDNNGNTALHLAANLKEYRPWLAPKAVLQMQWEIKWYEYIKENMQGHMSNFQNKKGKTAEALFLETHTELLQKDTEWLMKTSDSCTIVATLIATVAFATSASVPGGVNGRNGEPVLRQQRMFEVFAISSLVALCFSLTAAVMFLSILTSRHQAMDFGIDLPRKLLIGLTALFISIASVLVSFCGGHFFVLRNVLRDARVVEYLVVCVPVAIFAIMQCPLYFKLILATIKKEPKRGFMLVT